MSSDILKSYLIFFYTLTVFILNAQTWQRIEDFGGTERDDGVCFGIQDQVYCGTGAQDWATSSDFYAYDLHSGKWSEISSLDPSLARQYAGAFSIGGFGYLVAGIDQSGRVLRDVWRYDPARGQWTGLSPMPDSGRGGMCAFAIGTKGYILGGRRSEYDHLDDFYEYLPEWDEWKKLNNPPFPGKFKAACSVANGRAYVFGGRDENRICSRQLWEYEPGSDQWTLLDSSLSSGRAYHGLFACDSGVYLMGGFDCQLNYPGSLLFFQFENKTWIHLPEFPATPRRGFMYFQSKDALYLTTGYLSEKKRTRESWKWAPIRVSSEDALAPILSIQPNPVVDIVRIQGLENRLSSVHSIFIRDALGQFSLEQGPPISSEVSDLSGLPAGYYLMEIKFKDGNSLTKSLIKI